jgi:hypothetical protein
MARALGRSFILTGAIFAASMLLGAGIVAHAQGQAGTNSSRTANRAVAESMAPVGQVEIVDLSDICVIPNGNRCQVPKMALPGTRCRCGSTTGTIR